MTAYAPKTEIDWEKIYNRMEPDDRAVIDAWVKKLSAYTTARGGAGAMDAISINGLGEERQGAVRQAIAVCGALRSSL